MPVALPLAKAGGVFPEKPISVPFFWGGGTVRPRPWYTWILRDGAGGRIPGEVVL